MSCDKIDQRLLEEITQRISADSILRQITEESNTKTVLIHAEYIAEMIMPGITAQILEIPNVYPASCYAEKSTPVLICDFGLMPCCNLQEITFNKLKIDKTDGVSHWGILREHVESIVIDKTPKLIEPHKKNNRKIKISNIILSGMNNSKSLEQMLTSYVEQTPVASDVETVIVINGSTDDSAIRATQLLQSHQHKIIYHNTNLGIAGGFNEGLLVAEGEYLCLLQDDILFSQKNWHRELSYYLDLYPQIGQVGGFRGGVYFNRPTSSKYDPRYYSIGNSVLGPCDWSKLSTDVVQVDAVLCMCAMHRKEMGLYNEDLLPNGIEDIAFSFDIRGQGKEVWVTDVGIIHGLTSATRGTGEAQPIDVSKRLSRAYHFDVFDKHYAGFLRNLPPNADPENIKIQDLEHLLPSMPRCNQ